MKRQNMIKLMMLIAVSVCLPQQSHAQFLKNLGKVAGKVLKEATKEDGNTANNKVAAPSVTTGNDGVTIINPGSELFTVEFVSAVGNKAANTVTIHVKAKAKKLNYSNAYIGGRNQGRAYDDDGNQYRTESYGESRDLNTDIPVKFELAKFVKVPASVTSFPVVYASWYLDVDNNCPSGNTFMQKAIQLKNVPITWE